MEIRRLSFMGDKVAILVIVTNIILIASMAVYLFIQ